MEGTFEVERQNRLKDANDDDETLSAFDRQTGDTNGITTSMSGFETITWFTSFVITPILFVFPILIKCTFIVYGLTLRMWTSIIFVLHMTLSLWSSLRSISSIIVSMSTKADQHYHQNYSPIVNENLTTKHESLEQDRHRSRWIRFCKTLPVVLIDIILFGFLYTSIWNILIKYYLTDYDGTTVVEFKTLRNNLKSLKYGGYLVFTIRSVLLLIDVMTLIISSIIKCFNNKKLCDDLTYCYFWRRSKIYRKKNGKPIKRNKFLHILSSTSLSSLLGLHGEAAVPNRHHSSYGSTTSTAAGIHKYIKKEEVDDEEDVGLYFFCSFCCYCFSFCYRSMSHNDLFCSMASMRRQYQCLLLLRILFILLTMWTSYLLGWCLYSSITHWSWWYWDMPSVHGIQCDPLDTTECCLPFPSSYYLRRDATTETGYRVNLHSNALPPMRGGLFIDPTYLNDLDGFSTSSPILFYLDGLKEAQDSYIVSLKEKNRIHLKNNTNRTLGVGYDGLHIDEEDLMPRLQGPETIELSITSRSITLLVDVTSRTLVPHTAEIDYLDAKRPLVMVFPAKPLRHNTHYALAVINAHDVNGNRIAPTPGMLALLDVNNKFERSRRYHNILIPALMSAAPWFIYENDPYSLQLMFEFVTISESSQLGPIRSVRDATVQHVNSSVHWGNWSDHVRLIKKTDSQCFYSNGKKIPNQYLARTIHAELDIPWFLQHFGDGHRGAFLDLYAVTNKIPVTVGKAKFVVHIPCSIKGQALNIMNTTTYYNRTNVTLNNARDVISTDLKAIVEYGHGLFYDRAESTQDYLLKMANNNGYIIMAMDWRGMSAFDMLIVFETLMSTPRLFQATRDNLIQGYAAKIAMQHFSQNGMLDMKWMKFSPLKPVEGKVEKRIPIPTMNNQRPASIFMGVSQGGILGAGYAALLGPTGLIDRGIIQVPGLSFAYVLSRSLDFYDYDKILLLNFYNNRHVRIFVNLCQMGWDSVEGGGLLAGPINEKYPRMLIQAGLGDTMVPTLAAEVLARAFNASILPNNPRRDIFGIGIASAADPLPDDTNVLPEASTYLGPDVTLTEILYENEYKSLPDSDKYRTGNNVHECARRDAKLVQQMTEFINTGKVIDPCEKDLCYRSNATC